MRKIIVFSDYICPFCYIGKHRMEELAAEFVLQSVWKPFEIHPEVPPEGVPIEHFPIPLLERLETTVRALAGETGIQMKIPRKLSNSRLALVGGEVAREAERFEAYHEAVFQAYFQNEQDIGDVEVLARIAETIGLEREPFLHALSEKRFLDSIEAVRREALSIGLTAVPSFVLVDSSVITGVQPDSMMRKAIENSLQRER